MKEQLPTKYHFNWKENLYYSHHLSLRFEAINQAIAVLQKSLEPPTQASVSVMPFHQLQFWENLRSSGHCLQEIEDIHQSWLKVANLSHLNSLQLISLYEENILPLELAYQHILDFIQEMQKKKKEQNRWQPEWLTQSESSILEKTQNNLKCINKLKKEMGDALLIRAQIADQMMSPRNVDDVNAWITQKIRALKIPQPSIETGAISANLDDDTRLIIYDILLAQGREKKVIEKIIECIPKRGKPSLVSVKQINIQRNTRDEFNAKITDELRENGFGDYLFSLHPKSGLEDKKWLYFGRFHKIVAILSRLRYFIYLFLTLLIYHYLFIYLQPMLLAFFATSTVSLMSSILFFTFALSPLWLMVFNLSKEIGYSIHRFLTHWKVKEIWESLLLLEKTDNFIHSKLSHSIIDVPHFNFENLMQRTQNYQSELKNLKTKVEKSFFVWPFIFGKRLNAKVNEVAKEIENQQTKLESHINKITHHVADNISNEMELLCDDVHEGKLVPILSQNGFQKVKSFVEKYGDQNSIKKFHQHSDIVKKWFSRIDEHFAYDNPILPELNQPWGSQCIRQDALKGWDTLLNAFASAVDKKEASLKINKLLKGELKCTKVELFNLINLLAPSKENDVWLRKIQAYLFNTLPSRLQQHAQLLSDHHQMLIEQWHEKYIEKIVHAKTTVEKIFRTRKPDKNSPLDLLSDDILAHFYDLLDGDDYYRLSHAEDVMPEQLNKVRAFFERYQGESSRAFRLLKLISHSEKNRVIIEIAKKRLNWIIGNLPEINPKDPFDEVDIELFFNYRLAQEKFNCSDFVRQHSTFDGIFNEKYLQFLFSCKENGLDDGSLHDQYLSKNKRVQTFLNYYQQHLNIHEEHVVVSKNGHKKTHHRTLS